MRTLYHYITTACLLIACAGFIYKVFVGLAADTGGVRRTDFSPAGDPVMSVIFFTGYSLSLLVCLWLLTERLDERRTTQRLSKTD